jgi:NADH-quinone oxidoreductase subunit J
LIEQTGAVVAFWVLSVAAVGSSIMIVFSRNLLHAVLFLVLSFIALAGLYIVLSADFVAMAQILIYAGALSVLIVFAVMLTPRSARDNSESRYQVPAWTAVGFLLVAILFVVLRTDWPADDSRSIQTTAEAIGASMLDTYVLPFEIAGVLLTVAMVGALVLLREEAPTE